MRGKRGVAAHARHHEIKLATKGMIRSRRSSSRKGNEALLKSLSYAYRDRRRRKSDFKSLWITRISAGLTRHSLSYSQFFGLAKKANLGLNRKMLAELATNHDAAFDQVVASVSAS